MSDLWVVMLVPGSLGVGYLVGWFRSEIRHAMGVEELGRALRTMARCYGDHPSLRTRVEKLADRLLGE